MATNPDKDVKAGTAGNPDQDVKIVLDPVYGTIPLDNLAVKIIDTPWFQRLRYIKQLAFADYVYPGAMHTRFAHSIGVYHLARQMIKEIEKHLPKQMDPWDKRCIRVAALCHDLGHGPFSHLYEQIGKEIVSLEIKHEDVSEVVMEEILRDDIYFETCFDKKLTEAITLIKKLINPKNYTKEIEKEKEKKYMFQIVSNEASGVDVDKWDYFNRDAIACGVPERFQYDRALSVARVVKMDGDVYELAYRDYDAFNFYNMYNTRLTMYRKVYKHKAVVAVDLMMRDVFDLVQKQFDKNKPQRTKDASSLDQKQLEKSEPQSGSIDLFPVRNAGDVTTKAKIEAFQTLNDSVLFKIGEKNTEAKTLIDRIHKRQLYKMVIDILIPEDKTSEEEKTKVRNQITTLAKKYDYTIPDNVEIKEITFDYGDKKHDPILKLCFYRKGEDSGYRTLRKRVSPILPQTFQEFHLRVYYKKPIEKGAKAYEMFETFKTDLKGYEKEIHDGIKGSSVNQDGSDV